MKIIPAVCAFLALCPARGLAAGKMNVIFLDICSTRADHFGAYGYKRDTTPNMDAFGKGAAVFENAMSEGSCPRAPVRGLLVPAQLRQPADGPCAGGARPLYQPSRHESAVF